MSSNFASIIRKNVVAFSLVLVTSFAFADQVVLKFDTTQPVPMSPALSGFNLNELSNTWQPEDPLFLSNTLALQPQILRFPGGGEAGRYDWRNGGDITTKFIDRAIELGLTEPEETGPYLDQAQVRIKGGLDINDYYYSVVVPANAQMTVVINSLTDIPAFPLFGEPALPLSAYAQSAKELAAYIKENGIKVDGGFDILNEPYLQGKLIFWGQIWNIIDLPRESGESLGHYNGRVYMKWAETFADAIRTELPDAKIIVKPSPVKNVAFTYNGETDPEYQANFNKGMWEYTSVFYDAISMHWYPCLPLVGATDIDSKNCLAGNAEYLAIILKDYYAANNGVYLGKPDMPVLITEMGLALENPMAGTMYNAIFLAESLLRNARIPQFASQMFTVLAGSSATNRGAFKLLNQKNWSDISQDAYKSTSASILSSVLPFYNAGLVTFETFADHLDDWGQPLENALIDFKLIPTIPNASTTPPFSDYSTYQNIHGTVLQMLNNIFSKGVTTYPGVKLGGSMVMVPVGLQPTLPLDTGLGTTILETGAIISLGVLDNTGKRHVLIVNKSDMIHKVKIVWGNTSPGTSSWKMDSVSSADYMVKNTDTSPTAVTMSSATVIPRRDAISIAPYSVSVISLDL